MSDETPILSTAAIRRAPKVLLHDHLDGGLRAATVLELAEQTGYTGLPATGADELNRWFTAAADSGSLQSYLRTFAHTCGVMQTEDALVRVAAEGVEDLAEDGVVYAEIRYAPELFVERVFHKHLAPVSQRFVEALSKALPELPPSELLWRLHFSVGVLTHTMLWGRIFPKITNGVCDISDREALVDRAVRFAAAGFRAPASKGSD